MATTRGAHLRLVLVAAGVVLTVAGVTRLANPGDGDFGAPAAASPTGAVAGLTAAEATPGPTPVSPTGAPPTAAQPTAARPTPSRPTPTVAVEEADQLPTDVAASGPPQADTTADDRMPPATILSAPVADRPVTVRLDRLGVSAEIDGVLSVDGVLQVPDDPQRVGWWMASSMPGAEVGTTVLDGHLDSATRGVGFFVHLRELNAGDLVTVTTAAGGTVAYAVEARRTYPKSAPLPAELFDRRGSPALLLVTCGGPFDDSRQSYEDNIVVTARPA